MIVRWGLDALPSVLEEVSVSDPLLISTERWRGIELPLTRRFHGVQPHAEVAGVREARAAADGAHGLIALGGGSAIDTAKAVSSERASRSSRSRPRTRAPSGRRGSGYATSGRA